MQARTMHCRECWGTALWETTRRNVNTGAVEDSGYQTELWCDDCRQHVEVDREVCLVVEADCLSHSRPVADCRAKWEAGDL